MVRRAGFSLIELMVAIAVSGIAMLYMLGSVSANNRVYMVIDQVAETQQGMRAVANLLERDLRHAGLMVPLGAALCGLDASGGPDLLYVSDAEVIDSRNDLVRYGGADITGTPPFSVGGAVTLSLNSLVLEPAPPARPALDTDGNGTNESDFREGGGVIVIDLNDPARGTVCGTVKTVNPGGTSITIDPVRVAPLGTTTDPVNLVAIPAHEYRINGDRLLRDGILLTAGVEDLQLAYFLDADDDNEIDMPGEMRGTGETGVADYVAKDTDMSLLREIRLNLVVRTRAEDQAFTGRPQAMENRAAGAADGFRRRVYTSRILPRNLLSGLGS